MTTVYEIYNQLKASGMSEKEAAKEAQKRTGLALRTGRPIKPKTSIGGPPRKRREPWPR